MEPLRPSIVSAIYFQPFKGSYWSNAYWSVHNGIESKIVIVREIVASAAYGHFRLFE